MHDGSNDKPIYVAIKGTVFDVTKKADMYGSGKSYNIFAVLLPNHGSVIG